MKNKGKISIRNNFYFLISGHIIGKAISLLTFVILARNLGVERFGRLSYFLSIIGIFSLLPDLGISYLSIREAAGETQEFIQSYFNRILSLKISLASVSFFFIILICVSFGRFLNIDLIAFLFLVTAMILDSITIQLRSVTVVFENMKYDAFSIIVEGLSKTILVLFAFLFLRLDILVVSFVFFLSSLLTLFVTCWVINKQFIKIRITPGFDFDFAKKLIVKAAPIAFLSVFEVLNFRIDTIMIKYQLGSLSTGLYASSIKIIEPFLIIPVTFTAALFPVISRSVKDNAKIYLIKLLQKSLLLFTIFGFTIAIIMNLFVNIFIKILLGAQFYECGSIISLLSWLLVLFFFKFLLNTFLLVIVKGKPIFLFYALGIAVHIILNKLCIDQFGIQGVYISNFTSSAVIVIASILYLYNLKSFKIDNRNLVNAVDIGIYE